MQLKAIGGDSWIWTGNTTGLSQTNISNPIASPNTTTTYTVKATDKYNCFTQTANIVVNVRNNPSVKAGKGAEIIAGTPFQLNVQGSSDVVKWLWEPDQYLDCSTCTSPIANPREPMNYKVTGFTQYGCYAIDMVSIKLLCSENRIFIPNTFTPNGDGLNDNFSVVSSAIEKIKSFRIFDRWGKVIFEKQDYFTNDKSAAWDGTYKGFKVSTGAYVYIVEMMCNGKPVTRKGTISVLY